MEAKSTNKLRKIIFTELEKISSLNDTDIWKLYWIIKKEAWKRLDERYNH